MRPWISIESKKRFLCFVCPHAIIQVGIKYLWYLRVISVFIIVF
nr:MAG TPA: hypothetical protein [Caudoviricetes sp.]